MNRLLRWLCPDEALRWERSWREDMALLRWRFPDLPDQLRARIAYAETKVNDEFADRLPAGCRVVFDGSPRSLP